MTRPRVYTLTEAAQRMGVSERTIRAWVAGGHLAPVPGSRTTLGYHLYTEPALVAADIANDAGRVRRRDRERVA